MNGLFGTHASIFTDIGLICVQLSLISALIAYYYIKKKQPLKHRFFMLIGVGFLYIFLIFYILNYSLNGVKTFGGEGSILIFYYIFLLVHTIGATTLGLVGSLLVFRSLKRFHVQEKNEWDKFKFEPDYRSFHRKLGKINLILWIFTSLSGLLVYYMLYILYQPIQIL